VHRSILLKLTQWNLSKKKNTEVFNLSQYEYLSKLKKYENKLLIKKKNVPSKLLVRRSHFEN